MNGARNREMSLKNRLKEHVFVYVQSALFKVFELFKKDHVINSLYWRINQRIDTLRIIETKQDEDLLENMHCDTFSEMMVINLYFVRDSLLEYFKQSVIKIARDTMDVVIPTFKELESGNYPKLVHAVVALPLRYFDCSSSDDTILLINGHAVEKVLKKMLVLRKKWLVESAKDISVYGDIENPGLEP
jgi:hypothetical protein